MKQLLKRILGTKPVTITPGWDVRYESGFDGKRWRDDKNVRYYSRPAAIARGIISRNGVEMKEDYSYNGSGKTAFGGAERWPHLKVEIGFPEGNEKARDLFALKLRAFISENLK